MTCRYKEIWVSSLGNVETEWSSSSLKARREALGQMEIWGQESCCVEGL